MNPYVNLKNCQKGDLLVLKDGQLAKYVEYKPEEYFPHEIEYYNKYKSKGTRCDDGTVFKNNKLDTDFDVVLIFPAEMNTKQFRNKLLKNKNLKWEDVKDKYEKEKENWVIGNTSICRDPSKFVLIELEDPKKPKLEDFYDKNDPLGCSSSEYNEYLKALEEYDKTKH